MHDLEPEDKLITRVVDREDDPAVWGELDSLAAGDPALWNRLTSSLREDAWLRSTVLPALDVAERVGLPVPVRRGGLAWFTWCGWLAAAVFAVFALTSGRVDSTVAEPRLAGTELDSIVLEAQPAASGEGYDVLLLRRAIQRTHVQDLYRLAWDEHGRPNPVPATLPQPTIRGDF